MAITMDTLHEDIVKIKEQLAGQVPLLNQIMQQLQQNAISSAQMTTQLSAVSAELLVIKSEMAQRKSQVEALMMWKNDTPNLFIPRREQEAWRYEQRITELEDWRQEFTEKIGQEKVNFLTWLLSPGLPILISVLGFLANYFHWGMH